MILYLSFTNQQIAALGLIIKCLQVLLKFVTTFLIICARGNFFSFHPLMQFWFSPIFSRIIIVPCFIALCLINGKHRYASVVKKVHINFSSPINEKTIIFIPKWMERSEGYGDSKNVLFRASLLFSVKNLF